MSLQERQLETTFTIGEANFVSSATADSPSGSNTTTLSGLRTSAKVVKAGGRAMAELDLTLYGMKLSDMNQLSTLGMQVQAVGLTRRNTVLLKASDGSGGFQIVFWGIITQAFLDATGAPDVCFRVNAQSNPVDAVYPLPPSSYSGANDIISIMSDLAQAMGYAFQNYGIQPGSIMLNNVYLSGSPQQQWMKVRDQANISAFLDDVTRTLVIYPKGGFLLKNGPVPLVAPPAMINYPAFTPAGIKVRSVFNPSIGFASRIQVKSPTIPAANGLWTVSRLDYDLEANVLGGLWQMDIEAWNFVSQPNGPPVGQ